MTRRTSLRLLGVIGGIALVAIAVFGFLSWKSISVERVDADGAASRFDAYRSTFAGHAPILRVERGLVIQSTPPAAAAARPARLRVVAYRASDERLVSANVPYWFLRMKGPAVQYSLRDTGLDLARLGLTPRDLERYGPALVLDETRANGDRLLVWTE